MSATNNFFGGRSPISEVVTGSEKLPAISSVHDKIGNAPLRLGRNLGTLLSTT